MNIALNIIPVQLLEQYKLLVSDDIGIRFDGLHDSGLSMPAFSFYTSVSAVFSSKIEGEDIELDAFIKHKRLGAHFLPDYTRKTDDLYSAYEFAQQTKPDHPNAVYDAHAIITRHILQKGQQGSVRAGNMFVLTDEGRIEYVAASPAEAQADMALFLGDIHKLLEANLDFKEALYFAAMIHLVFVKIHPFEDGNGRTARLLEKWFLAARLGPKAWFVQSEKYYYNQHQTYYRNIRALGLEYIELDYSKSLQFLLMLPAAI
jgi:Fic family protein